jgi:two-component system response regulator PilR (NtrC family)
VKEEKMAKILVVDDEPALRGDLEWAAQGKEREVVAAENGQQAIQLILENDFDVVVTDLKMEPEATGLDVLKAAKEKDLYAQVILVTAYGTPEISVEAMRLGAYDYLERNAPGTEHLAMLRAKVTQALEYRHAKLIEVAK